MKWYIVDRDGKSRTIKNNGIRSLLLEKQIQEAVEAKKADPLEEVSYYIGNGCFVIYDY